MAKKNFPTWATTVTPFSKFLALTLFIFFPFVGFYAGTYSQHTLDRATANSISVIPSVHQAVTTQQPDTLIVYRTENIQTPQGELVKVVTDTKKVQTFYSELTNLAVFPSGFRSCPLDFLQRYILDFYVHGTQIAHAIFDPTGCRGIDIPNAQSKWTVNAKGEAFLNDLQQTLMLARF